MNTIQTPDHAIGPNEPTFLVAEIGINHNGDMDLAQKTIDAALEAGADAVKFQNYRTEDFVSDRTINHEYISQGEKVVEPQWDMFKRYELSTADLKMLSTYCETQGITFFSTPTSRAGVDELEMLNAPLIKNGSDYLVHLPLIRMMAKTAIPTILSTGMATLSEIDDAVRAFEEAGGEDLILLHCVSSYPAPMEHVNLRQIPAMQEAFQVPIGFSDHTQGTTAAVGAVTVGACLIEKHFTLDKSLPGPDHRFSADPEEFRRLVNQVRAIEAALGEPEIGPTGAEVEARQAYRLSCVAAEDLSADTRLTHEDIRFKRPGYGWPPKAAPWIVGRRLRREVSRGHPFQPEDFE